MSTISASTTSTTAYKVTADTTGTLVLQTGATPTTAVTIDGSQNVGIGTSSPAFKLNVYDATSCSIVASTPASDVQIAASSSGYGIVGTYNNYPLVFRTNAAERMRIDTSGNVGIGTTNPTSKLYVSSTGLISGRFVSTQATNYLELDNATGGALVASNGDALVFCTSVNGIERARFDTNGYFLVGKTANTPGVNGLAIQPQAQGAGTGVNIQWNKTTSGTYLATQFVHASSVVGSIGYSDTATTYNTSSDYRLKENIAPMVGALAAVAQLKPCTYTWKLNGEATQGFIAHELQAVVPDCVTGEKDAVDADGNPVYQGIDTSFLVATLTAAIQELKAELDAAKTDIATLKGAA